MYCRDGIYFVEIGLKFHNISKLLVELPPALAGDLNADKEQALAK